MLKNIKPTERKFLIILELKTKQAKLFYEALIRAFGNKADCGASLQIWKNWVSVWYTRCAIGVFIFKITPCF